MEEPDLEYNKAADKMGAKQQQSFIHIHASAPRNATGHIWRAHVLLLAASGPLVWLLSLHWCLHAFTSSCRCLQRLHCRPPS